jgi:hypothetical protein
MLVPSTLIAVKSVLASRTIWGASISIVAAAAGLAGVSVTPEDTSQAMSLAQEALATWDRIAVLAGSAVAIWGRITATRRIG